MAQVFRLDGTLSRTHARIGAPSRGARAAFERGLSVRARSRVDGRHHGVRRHARNEPGRSRQLFRVIDDPGRTRAFQLRPPGAPRPIAPFARHPDLALSLERIPRVDAGRVERLPQERMNSMAMPLHRIVARRRAWIDRRGLLHALDESADRFARDRVFFARRQHVPGRPEQRLRLDTVRPDATLRMPPALAARACSCNRSSDCACAESRTTLLPRRPAVGPAAATARSRRADARCRYRAWCTSSSSASTKSRALVRLICARFSQLASVVEHREIERRVEIRHTRRVEHRTALDVQLAGDLQPVQVPFAVAHHLIGPIAVLVGMCRLPVAGIDVLRGEPHGSSKRKVGLKDIVARLPSGPLCASMSEASAMRAGPKPRSSNAFSAVSTPFTRG